ncbi:hypothetical protein [Solimonas soli]|uniref:hypothetical protein n=1 Tax=Solimonas soli TaxID=413479 RepID=UPI0004B521E7
MDDGDAGDLRRGNEPLGAAAALAASTFTARVRIAALPDAAAPPSARAQAAAPVGGRPRPREELARLVREEAVAISATLGYRKPVRVAV